MPILTLFKKSIQKKSRRSSLIKALDALVSRQVRERDGYRCRKCGVNRSGGRVYHHHIFTKIRLTTRWDLKNGVTLCFYCHRWAHSAGEEFREWVLTWMPAAEYESLYLKSQMHGGYKECDLEWLLIEMRRAA